MNIPITKMLTKQSLLAILLCFVLTGVKAQIGKHFDADNMMSSSYTTQVYVDRVGFVWVATRNGLNRYDGYQYSSYKKESKQYGNMASNYVNCIIEDRKSGIFYIGMWGAFQTFDGQQFQDVKTYDAQGRAVPCYITCLLQRSNGDILIGTSGHGILRMRGTDEAHPIDGALKNITMIQRLMEDSKGRLWIATSNDGLWMQGKQGLKHYFTSPDERATLADLCEDKKGNIYVGTTNNGLFKLTPSPSVGGTLSGGNSSLFTLHFSLILGTQRKHISALYLNKAGNIMIGYDGEGLAIFNPATGKIIDNPYYSRDVDLSKAKIYSITEDLNGNYWFGLLQKGVYMQPSIETGFSYMGYKLDSRNVIGTACVTSVLISRDKRMWIGTDKDGLYCLAYDGSLIKHFAPSSSVGGSATSSQAPSSPWGGREGVPSTILTLAEDTQGRIWAGSYKEGMGWIDPATMTWHRKALPQGNTVSVFGIQADKQGDIWVGTMGEGLLRFNPDKGGDIKTYSILPGAAENRKVNSIVNNYISQISLSPDQKRVYTATTMGLCALDIKTGSWTSTFHGTNCPNYGTPVRIAKEIGGKVRIGTNNGLLCYDFKTHEMHNHDIEGGLADNGISSFEEDSMHRLWIATDHGLCCVDTKTRNISSYFVDNGLQANEFSDGASFAAPDGRMLFGGLGGITWFYPNDIKKQEWNAQVKLVGFKVNGEAVTQATMSGLWRVTDSPVISSERFTLANQDNSFALQLSTLTYDNPEHIVYRYSINNEDWVRMQPGINEITFSHIQPGTYHFRIVADRNDITTPELRFTVVIHSPWYATTLAYICYALMLLAAIGVYLRYRRRKEQDRLRLQEHIHAEEMADAKLKFFMNISHEIRTPMTLIVTPLLSLLQQEKDTHKRGIYMAMQRNAQRILSLINQMMDLRKIDKGQMQMHMQQTDIIPFIQDIYSLFTEQAKAKNIKFTYEHSDDQLNVWIDRSHFDKIVVNILSNAFKFTPREGIIRINLTTNNPTSVPAPNSASDPGSGEADSSLFARHSSRPSLILTIYNNGEKIPEDKLERIFERFYQTPSNINDRNTGTGIGLDLTRALVELHHGTITARNAESGEGCEFIITIPLGKSHLKEEEIMEPATPAEPTSSLTTTDATALIGDSTLVGESAIPSQAAPSEADSSLFTLHSSLPNGRARIVIAEDDTEILRYLEEELREDYDVVTCENGRIALGEILKQIPQLVISDVMMPEMDGNTLCSKIKANAETSHVPVILLTAKSRDEDQIEGLATGADAYILKPFNMDILKRTIDNLIHTRQQLQLKYGRNDQLEQQVDDIYIQSPDEKLLDRIMRTINDNLTNSDLSVDMIASEVGISRVHLHRKMKELTGQTPHDFIRNLRLKQAANLLASGNMNVTEVVYACGFGNAPSFSTTFKRFYGMTPREYMAEHNKVKDTE